jgi:hypothetical protein
MKKGSQALLVRIGDHPDQTNSLMKILRLCRVGNVLNKAGRFFFTKAYSFAVPIRLK